MNAIQKDDWIKHIRIAARTIEILGGAVLILYAVARGFGFTSTTTGERLTTIEGQHQRIALVLDTLHMVDVEAADRSQKIELRLDKIERVGCVQLSIRERDLIGSCYGTPLSPERTGKKP